MTDLIMQLAGVIQRDMDALRDVSQNVANANTPGYKAVRPFSVFAAGQNADVLAAQGLAGIEHQSVIKGDAGTLHMTGKPTDLALSGDAWFVLQTPQGQHLTRDGRFRIDAGLLVSQAGYPVLGRSGPLWVGQGVLKVDATGAVAVDDREIDQLRLVRVADMSTLSSAGAGRYHSSAPLQDAARHVAVHQGMQERSNAHLGSDMVKIMEVSRHVETVQRALSAYDGMLNSGINQLGKD